MSLGTSEAISVFLLAIALGLDGFSVCIGLGLQNLRWKRIFLIGLAIGFFHILFPVLGLMLGKMISLKLTAVTEVLSSALFISLGAYIFFSSFTHPQQRRRALLQPDGFKLLTLAMLVSIDSFPVGFSLGLSGMQIAFYPLYFGIIAMFLSWLGLFIGRQTYAFLGRFSERCGGFIIFAYGIFYLFFHA